LAAGHVRYAARMAKRVVAVATAVACATLLVTASAASRSQPATATVTAGKPAELRFTLSKKTVPKGAVTFTVTNRGKLKHDFKIAGKKTPILGAGKRATLAVSFKKAGRFPYLCTVPGHAAGGMKGTLVVK
jgi:uncharacterized cupredoxin-like copper-binding protein